VNIFFSGSQFNSSVSNYIWPGSMFMRILKQSKCCVVHALLSSNVGESPEEKFISSLL
jgi:hypothetical protein